MLKQPQDISDNYYVSEACKLTCCHNFVDSPYFQYLVRFLYIIHVLDVLVKTKRNALSLINAPN